MRRIRSGVSPIEIGDTQFDEFILRIATRGFFEGVPKMSLDNVRKFGHWRHRRNVDDLIQRQGHFLSPLWFCLTRLAAARRMHGESNLPFPEKRIPDRIAIPTLSVSACRAGLAISKP